MVAEFPVRDGLYQVVIISHDPHTGPYKPGSQVRALLRPPLHRVIRLP